MIQRKETINISLTPREIESEIWNMDSEEQADLILAMAQRYKNNTYSALMQMVSVEDDFKKMLNDDEKRDAIRLFETILEYLKGGKE